MKVNNINKNLSHIGVGLSELFINKRTYKGMELTLFREFFKKKLEVSVLLINDKVNKHSGFRLKHINNSRLVKKIDRFI